MGNTPSVLPDGSPVPTKEEMRIAEDACAETCHSCDVLEYPSHLRIHRDYVLHNSGKLHRWHIVIHSGVPASKWPRDIGKEPGYVQDVINATKKLGTIIPEQGQLFGVSLIPLGPESNCNAQEATDLTIFPEFVRYYDVTRENIEKVLEFHVKVIAPRAQALKYHQSDPSKYPSPTNPVLSDEQLTQLAELGPWKFGWAHDGVNLEPQGHENLKPRRSQFLQECDRLNHPELDSTIPPPMEIEQDTIILLCGHMIRDKRCGITGSILKEQIEMVLDQKHPEHVNRIYTDLVSHVGGHKVAGNMLIFSKCLGFVFYGRVFPQHIENILEKTVIGGEILQPITRACHDGLW